MQAQTVRLEWEDFAGYACADLPISLACPACRAKLFRRLDVQRACEGTHRPVGCTHCGTRYAFPRGLATRRMERGWLARLVRWCRGLFRRRRPVPPHLVPRNERAR